MDRQPPAIPDDIEALRRRVETWRKIRTKRSPMPEELWSDAARLAAHHGYRRVARTLRINYDSLKERLERGSKKEGKKTSSPEEFVEMRASEVFGASQSPGSVVEMTDGKGCTLTIRLAEGEKLDVHRLVAAFRSRRA